MKKSLKKIMLSVAMIMSLFASSLTVLAVNPDTDSGAISGYNICCYSRIYVNSGYAYTAASSTNVTVTVSSEYKYQSNNSAQTYTETKNATNQTGTNIAQVDFTCASNYHSVKLSSTHTASYRSTNFDATTCAR